MSYVSLLCWSPYRYSRPRYNDDTSRDLVTLLSPLRMSTLNQFVRTQCHSKIFGVCPVKHFRAFCCAETKGKFIHIQANSFRNLVFFPFFWSSFIFFFVFPRKTNQLHSDPFHSFRLGRNMNTQGYNFFHRP